MHKPETASLVWRDQAACVLPTLCVEVFFCLMREKPTSANIPVLNKGSVAGKGILASARAIKAETLMIFVPMY
jgi:hypothetical protein